MKSLCIRVMAILCCLETVSQAVDGIAVSAQYRVQWTSVGDIVRYNIRNNDQVSRQTLFDGKGGDASLAKSRARFPVINMSGTLVAFYRTHSDSGNFVSLVNVDGTGLRNLVKLPAGSDYNANGYLDWPRGDWVYYQQAEGPQRGGRNLRRVNVADGRDELVCAFAYGLWEWGLSADVSRMHLRTVEADNAPFIRGYYQFPGNCTLSGSNRLGDANGCGVGISPSGQWLINLSGGSHNWIGVTSWEHAVAGVSYDIGITSEKLNSWVVNKIGLTTTCTWNDVRFESSVGYGMNRNRYSRNSDKWACLCFGWEEAAGSSGRFGWCGMNQALLNWQDSVVVNVSKNPRACQPNQYMDYTTGCDVNQGGSLWACNDAGDFWCSTIEDVNPDLRELVRSTVGPAHYSGPRSARARGLMIVFPSDARAGVAGPSLPFDLRGRAVAGPDVRAAGAGASARGSGIRLIRLLENEQ